MGNCLEAIGLGDDKNKTTNKNDSPEQKNDQQSSQDKKSHGRDKHSKESRASAHSLHDGLLHEKRTDVYQKYVELEVLGTGSMGHVAKVQIKDGVEGGSAYRVSANNSRHGNNSNHSSSSADMKKATSSISATTTPSERQRKKIDYALKSIQLDRVSPAFVDELKNEIDILKTMDHPNIVKLHEVYYHKKQIYMILELCDGGDLYTRLPYTEKDSAYITGKLLSAVKYMHDHGIVHRDLKFENIMFENKSTSAEIKVIDFGLSKKFANKKIGVMHEGVGTLYSMAPQVLQGVYTSQADMWSCGVITYMLLSSHRPFYNKKRKIMIDRIMRCDYTFDKDYWKPVSAEAKDFISKLLVIDPKVRFNASQAQEHKWLSKEFKLCDRAPTESFQNAVADNLLVYKDTARLKKIALNVIAKRSSTDDILQLRMAFDQFDTSNDGIITYEEFKEALKKEFKYNDKEVKEMFDSIDVNNNGHIMYTEFIAATLEAHGYVEEERIAEAFDRLDVDNSGYISKENMLEFLGEDATMEDVERMLNDADLDNDGQISFDEFLNMFNKQDKLTLQNMNSFDSRVSSTNSLLGLDANIPGGKNDPFVGVGLEQGQREQDE